MHKLGITQYKSSAHHPQSQGALERWHKHWRPWWESTASKRRKIGTRAFICCCLLHESRCRSLWDSVPLRLCLDTLWEGLLSFSLQRSYYCTFKIFILSFLESLRLPVPSGLNIPEWRSRLSVYHDSSLCDFLEFGWPIGYTSLAMHQFSRTLTTAPRLRHQRPSKPTSTKNRT